MVEGNNRVIGGKYRLKEILGEGAIGVVWRAHDESLGRDVAVKEIRLPAGLDAERVKALQARALREARAAARLTHFGSVVIHEVVREDGRPWIIMELVRGRTLQQIVKDDGPLPPVRVAEIGRGILAALRAAHAAGVVHRDVKPSNVMLADERVVLTDFGIAALDDGTILTQTGAIIGTPAFMAPEQARGQAATPASDLWSLGATLYAAVEGHPPFEGETVATVIAALLTSDPPEPSLAGPLTPILGGLLAKDPGLRTRAGELATRLTTVARELAAEQYAEDPPADTARHGRHGSPGSTPRGRSQDETLGPGESAHDGRRHTSGARAPARDDALGSVAAWQQIGDAARSAPGGAVWQPDGESSRDGAWPGQGGAVWQPGGESSRDGVWPGQGGAMWQAREDGGPPRDDRRAVRGGAAWKPAGDGGKSCVLGRSAQGGVVWQPDGEPARDGMRSGARRRGVRRGAGRSRRRASKRGIIMVGVVAVVVLLVTGATIWLPRRSESHTTPRARRVTPSAAPVVRIGRTFPSVRLASDTNIFSVAFSPDGTTLACGASDSTVRLWDVRHRRQTAQLPGHSDSVESVAFSRDGRRLATAGDDETARLWDLTSGAQIAKLSGYGADVWSVDLSPDGRTLADGSKDGTIRLWDVATRTRIRVLRGHTDGVTTLRFSPDGRTLASGAWDDTVRLWNTATWAQTATLRGHTDSVHSVAFSPDGRTLASGGDDEKTLLWDLATHRGKGVLTGHKGQVASVAFSPDGRTLATSGKDDKIMLYDVASEARLGVLTGHTGNVDSVAFSPDGRTLASGAEDKSIRLWDLTR